MTRKKVKLQFIVNDSARKCTFQKRKKGLMKKVAELSILCGIEACAIIFSPYEAEPEVWPSPLGFQRVLARFRRMPEMEQSRKMMNQESFTRQMIMKSEKKLRKQQMENRHKEMTHVMYRCLAGHAPQNLSMVDLNELGRLLDQNIRDIRSRIESLKNEKNVGGGTVTVMNETRTNLENGVVARRNMAMALDCTMMNPVQDCPWYMDLLRPNVQPGGIETLLPYANNNSCPWANFTCP